MDSSLTIRDLIHGDSLADNSLLEAGLAAYPTTPGQHIVVLKADNLFNLPIDEFLEVATFVRHYSKVVKTASKVRRCGLAYDGFKNIHIIPMHGLSETWVPVRATETPMTPQYPGYLWTKSSPQLSDDELLANQKRLIACSGWTTPNNNFSGGDENSNLFARLIRGEIPQWRIWKINPMSLS